VNSTVCPAQLNPTAEERQKGRQKAKPFGTDFCLVSEAVVTGRKVGAGKEFWSALAHNEFLFRQLVRWSKGASQLGVGLNLDWASSDQLRVKKIMGGNFLSPLDVTALLPQHPGYSLRDMLDLATIPFSSATLLTCQVSHVLVPGISISLAELYQSFPDFVMPDTMKTSQGYALIWEKKVPQQWHLIRKQAIPGSDNLPFERQKVLLKDDEEMPGVAELYFAAMLCRACGNPILPDLVRCQDTLTANRERLSIVTRNSHHVDLVSFDDDLQMRHLGLASKKKPQRLE